MKNLLSLIFTLATFTGFCQTGKTDGRYSVKAMQPYLDMITAGELSGSLHYLASDYFEGRGTGTSGQKAAANYLASSYATMGILPMARTGNPLENYFQPFPFESRGVKGITENVLAFIEGSDPKLKNEIIVITAHYDHLGKNDKLEGDQIFNGAADDGSGTVALLEIAESLMAAKAQGVGPRRSVLFIHFSGEEIGLQGSIYYTTKSPALPLERVVANINLDGVGGIDPTNPSGTNNYVYVLQNDSTSTHLGERAKALNTSASINLNIVKPLKPSTFRSDNKSFEYMMVPSIYFSSGLVEHYHKVSDEPGTIDYPHMTKIVKLVFAVSWDLANSTAIKSTYNRANYELTGKFFCPPCGCDQDHVLFDSPGMCPTCKSMALTPAWKKKS